MKASSLYWLLCSIQQLFILLRCPFAASRFGVLEGSATIKK
ncbi:MAG: hypothetical protein OJF47_001542 [Nitrospira sp.]|nr:MAG: hypothetical protein OJF47_001542 [Nitrospira sp.]